MPPRKQGLPECLEAIYRRYNRRELIHPDPLEFLWHYPCLKDREIAGMVAQGLAYGRVGQILKSIEKVLSLLGPSPSDFLRDQSLRDLRLILRGFKHRFTTSDEMSRFLHSLTKIQIEEGLLGNLMQRLRRESGYPRALDDFAAEILKGTGMERNSLIPRPCLGSACKRLNLFMRWMVRSDEVDPGGWRGVSPSDLLVPLDTHMFQLSRRLGLTGRKTPSASAVMEITGAFRELNPADPVKYDFALTRMGIQDRGDDGLFVELCTVHGC